MPVELYECGDYPKGTENLVWRRALRECADGDEGVQRLLIERCRRDILFFFNAFVFLFEPRSKKVEGKQASTRIPFTTWEHQDPNILEFKEAVESQYDVGVEKSRGEGATWMILMTFLWFWLFSRHFVAFGIVSRNEQASDNPEDPDSLGWKLDYALSNLPRWMVHNEKGEAKQVEPSTRFHRSVRNHTWANRLTGSTITAYTTTGDLGRGGRKAQPLDSKILTPSGWVTMGSLVVGDEVIGRSGCSTTVVGVYPLGDREVFEVTFSDGSKVECCDDHLWEVTDNKQRKNNIRRLGRNWKAPYPQRTYRRDFSVLSLSEIRKDYVSHRKEGWNEYKYQIPIVDPVEFEYQDLPADPYLIGSLLGDGGLNASGSSVRFSTADSETIETLSEMLPEGCEFVSAGKYDYRISRGGRGGGDNTNAVKEVLRDIGLLNKLSHEKHIPDIYKYASVDERLELLRGLLDTDGWITLRGKVRPSCRVRFCSVSRQLAEDVRFVVESLGGVASMTSKFPTYSHNGERRTGMEAFELTIAMPAGMNPFRLSRKADLYCERSTYIPRRSIVAIRKVGRKPVQCIKVSADDNLYVTDHCVVTHNTAFALDEMASYRLGEDEAVMSSMVEVTDCVLMISTPQGPLGAYYKAMREDGGEGILKRLRIHWSENESRNRGLYTVVDGVPVAVDPVGNPLPDGYVQKWLESYRTLLLNRGFNIEEGVRSPWYDSKCLRPRMTPKFIAQEYDIDYGGSRSRFFPVAMLERLQKLAVPALWSGEIDFNDEEIKPMWRASESGHLLLWCELTVMDAPPGGVRYIVAADISTGQGGTHGSNSALSIVERDTGKKVGEFAHPSQSPELFAMQTVAICRWFNEAYLIWEDNGPGKAFGNKVLEIGYENIYFRELTNRVTRIKTKQPGFTTQRNNKGALLGAYSFALGSGTFENPSFVALEEAKCYEELGSGKIVHTASLEADPSGAGENHGDRCISDALANHALMESPTVVRKGSRRDIAHAPPGSPAGRRHQYLESLKEASRDLWSDRAKVGRGRAVRR